MINDIYMSAEHSVASLHSAALGLAENIAEIVKLGLRTRAEKGHSSDRKHFAPPSS